MADHMTGQETIHVEVAYGTAVDQKIIAIELPRGSSVVDAVNQSGIRALFSELASDQVAFSFGVFGEVVEPQTRLNQHDRVEIYRPLTVDPRDARRRRAKKTLRR